MIFNCVVRGRIMSKFPMTIFQLLNKLWVFFSYLCNKQFRKVLQYQPVKYDLYPLSPGLLRNSHNYWVKWVKFSSFAVSRHRLSLVQRKTLVLDLDETLIHSHHDGLPRNPTIKAGTPHDFTVSYTNCILFSFKISSRASRWCLVAKKKKKWK